MPRDDMSSVTKRSLTPKPFDASVRDRIAKLPRIAATCNLLVQVTSVEDSDLMILSAREWGGFSWNNLKLISERMPHDATEEAVVLGQTAAEILKKKVGDPIQIETKELKVVGIVKGGRSSKRISLLFAALCKESPAPPTRSTPSMFAQRPRRTSNNSQNSRDKYSSLSRKCGL